MSQKYHPERPNAISLNKSSISQGMEVAQDQFTTVTSQPFNVEVPGGDPFGDENGAAIKYKTMTWWQTGMIMIAETISLGILALPKVLATLGLLPGVAVIIGVGMLTTYTGLIIGHFKCQYLNIHSMADAGEVLFGKVGRTIAAAAQLIFFVFVMGSHLLTFSIMMNVLTEHATCTVFFSFLGLLISSFVTLPRRLEEISHLSSISFISIIGAVFMCIIGVSIENPRPERVFLFASHATPHEVCIAIANVVFAYAGHVAFFTLFSELRDIRDYTKALALLQVSEITLYTVSAILIYVFVGPGVASPALNSAGVHFRKISYGVAIPTILIGGVVNAHVAVKFLYIRMFGGTFLIHSRSWLARGIWAWLCFALWFLSWIVGESIPVFNDLLGFTSSAFATLFTFILPGLFGIHLRRDHWHQSRNLMFLRGVDCTMVAIGLTLGVLGIYSSIKQIDYHITTGLGRGSFSCANNA